MKKITLLVLALLFSKSTLAQLTDFVRLVGEPFDMVLIGDDIYFSERRNGRISKKSIYSTDIYEKTVVKDGILEPAGLAYKDGYLYIAEFNGDANTYDHKIVRINLAEENPTKETVIDNLYLPIALEIVGNILYFTTDYDGGKLMKFDLSDPLANPIEVLNNLIRANGLLLKDNELYIVLVDLNKIIKIDVSQENPIPIDVVTNIEAPTSGPTSVGDDLYFSSLDHNIYKINTISASTDAQVAYDDNFQRTPAGLLYNDSILYICYFSWGRIMKLQPALSIEDIYLNKIKLYPNPVSTHLTIDNLDIGSIITLYNSLGQKVEERVYKNEPLLDLQHLKDGLYFITINHLEHIKIIKKSN